MSAMAPEVFMKFFVFTLVVSLGSLAMVKKASIDGALSNRFDENYQETQRSLASQKEKPSKEKTKEGDQSEREGDRLPSSKGQSFEELNENGVRYWKY